MNRRLFIKKSCLTCCNMITFGLIANMLEGCISLHTITYNNKQNFIEINIDEFVNNKTKIRNKAIVLRPMWLKYDILLTEINEEYKALYMKCSHEDFRLTPTEDGIYCSAHGSAFDLKGNVIKEPAIKKLISFETKKINNKIVIKINNNLI